MIRILGIMLLTACSLPLEPRAQELAYPYGPNAITRQGADSALSCGQREGLIPKRSVESIDLYLVPMESFTVGSHEVAGATIGREVYLVESRKEYVGPWAHEMMHAFFDLSGFTDYDSAGRVIWDTHPPVFFHCGLGTP